MQFLRERLGLVLLIGVVAAMLLYSLRLAQEARDPRFTALPLSYSQHRYGVKGLARLLERNGYTVRSLKHTYRRLPKDADLLVIFPPPLRLDASSASGDWSAEDADALDAWLRKGGRLLLFSGDSRLPESLRGDGRNRLPIAQFPTDRLLDAQPSLPAPWLDGIQRVRLGDQRANLSPRKERWVPLLHLARLRWASMSTRWQASTSAREPFSPPSRRFWTMCAVGSVVGWDCLQARRCSSSSKPCRPTRRCATRSWRRTAPFRTRNSPPTRRSVSCSGLRRLITNPLHRIVPARLATRRHHQQLTT